MKLCSYKYSTYNCTLITKTNWKCLQPQSIKLSGVIVWQKLHGPGLSNGFLDPTRSTWATNQDRLKIWTSWKSNGFVYSKIRLIKKKQPNKWGNIFADNIFVQEYIRSRERIPKTVQKNKTDSKLGLRTWRGICPEKTPQWPRITENMFSVANYQGDANHSYWETTARVP